MPKKTFAEIAAARPRYNPEIEGYGHPEQWRESFRERMGLDEAKSVVGSEKTPRGILGVTFKATWEEIKTAYRKLMMDVHPDRIMESGLDLAEATKRARELNAAYAILAAEFGK